MKVLLVEDHAAVAHVSCSLLREVHEHEVEHAATAARAIELLPRFRPDVVLIDINLPDLDGCELARRIRALSGQAEVVLVALTGLGNVLDSDEVARAGFDAQFRKPMEFGILPRVVAESRASRKRP